jgi:hypothetical protein
MPVHKILRDILSALTGSTDFGLHPQALTSHAYPLDLEFTLEQESTYYHPKDEHGVPVRQYRSVGRQYNPTRIAAYGLAHYNRWITRQDDRSRTFFLQMADWFMRADDACWRYEFDWDDLKAPWISCMSQGEGISMLVRAYRMTEDERYLAQARRATAPMTLDIGAGGVRSMIEGTMPFLEEYPSTTPAHTLNGFFYALIGLTDLSTVDASAAEHAGLSHYIRTLESCWSRWDLGYWSAYDLHVSPRGRRNPATVAYHRLHVTQLAFLAAVHNSEPLRACHRQWDGYYHSACKRINALLHKIRYRREVPASA